MEAGARLDPGRKERRTRKKLEGSGRGRTACRECMVAVEPAVAEEAEEQTARSPQALQACRIQLAHDL
jgi:hypothetical protein